MTKEEIIQKVEDLQVDLKDNGKICILQLHVEGDTPKQIVQKILMELRELIKERIGEFSDNIILFPATDKVYLEKIEITKEDKLK